VFLSSTFRDFGEERDLLVRKVFPALRAKLKDRFVELVDVDLRWGITAEQAERGEVLPICLAEIDRSRPYFIGLLGERYGWVPGKEKYPPTLLRQRRWLKDHQGGKSVTELEILHGVLNAPEMAGRARFYFRSSAYAQKKRGEYLSVDKEDRKRQQALKARIRKSDFPVVRYATPVDLAKRLEGDLWQILDAEFPAESIPDAFARESMRHEAYAAPRRRLYLGGDVYLKTLKGLIRKNIPRILITGQSGGGKSALLANALVGMHTPRVNLFEHYLGASSDSADVASLVRRLIDYVRRVTQSTDDVPSDPQALFESLPTWLAIASAYAQKTRTRWVFVLDALNNLSSYQDLRWFPGYLPPRLSVVVSCLEGEVREALEAKGPWERMTIDPLDRAGQERLLTAYLRRYNKTLPTDLQAHALDHPLAGNPLWLKTLAEELRLFGSHEELERRLTTLLGHPKGKAPEEPPTVDDLFEHVLARIEDDHGQKLVRNALTSIWASRAGLSEPELLDILNCPPAIWAPIRYALDEMLLESGGRILFAHDYAKIAVRDRYLPTEKKQQQAHRSLAKYFAGKPVDSRVVEELPHQWKAARAWGDLKRSLTTLEIFEALNKHRSQEEHLSYWLAMEAAYNKQMLEQSMRRAWRRWALSEKEGYTGDVADNLATFLREAGRGITKKFLRILAELAFTITEKAYGSHHPHTGIRLNDLAILAKAQGDYTAAESLYRRALAITEKTQGPAHPAMVIRLNNLGQLLAEKSGYVGAEPLFWRALTIIDKSVGSMSPEKIAILGNLASLHLKRGECGLAEPLFRQALTITEKTRGPEHPDTGRALNNLAAVLDEKGDHSTAELLYRRALAITEKTQGPEHPSTGIRLNNLAGLLDEKGDHSTAELLYRRALAIAEKAQGPEHPSTGTCLNNLAGLLEAQGDYAAAEPLYRRALAINEQLNGSEHENTMQARCLLSDVLREIDKKDEALQLLDWSLPAAERLQLGGPFFRLGTLLVEQGDYKRAEQILKRCVEIRRATLTPTDPAITEALQSLDDIYRLIGRAIGGDIDSFG